MSVIDDIQSESTGQTRQTVRRKLSRKVQRFREERDLSRDAHIRRLLMEAEDALTGDSQLAPEAVLEELHWVLRIDERLPGVLSPRTGERHLTMRFKQAAEARSDGVDPDPAPEMELYAEIAEKMGVIGSASDMTRYAPVRLEALDIPGARSSTSNPTPIGRIRIPHDSTQSIEQKAVDIPHKDAEHILVLANPRKGKDSTICRICGNLKDEHGYKWISLFDDGRNETPMTAIPSDEDDIREILDRDFSQEPKGYETRVYVPATNLEGESLPANFEPFTIGVESLTPEMIATLSGVQPDAQIERRIRMALDNCGGDVKRLIELLERYAQEMLAEVEVTEWVDEGENDSYRISYEMDAEDVLEDCAESLAMLASEGLLASAGADTNIDMRAEMQAQDRIAVLNANTLPEGQEHIKYLLVNLWMRLVYRCRDEYPNLPRAVCEMREIKNLAPAKLNDTKFKTAIKSLRQTLFFISSQGGSRRIMMVGSTQKLNDLYKPVRGNMPIKLLLQIGQEKINTLRSSGFRFSEEERDQLEEFDPGWGMLIAHGDRHWPIQWCPALCGLGLGDEYWLERYARAMGFRFYDGGGLESEAWIDVEGNRIEDDNPDPEQWYLRPDDIREDEQLADALERRRDLDPPLDLRPEPVHGSSHDVDVLTEDEQDEREEELLKRKFGISGPLIEWVGVDAELRNRWLRVLRAVRDEDITSIREIREWTGVPKGSVSRYLNDEEKLGACVRKQKGEYKLTDAGGRALDVSWEDVVDEVNNPE